MLDANLLRPKQPGDPILAEDWNTVIDLLKRDVHGVNVLKDPIGWHVLGAPGTSGPGGFVGVVTSHGTPYTVDADGVDVPTDHPLYNRVLTHHAAKVTSFSPTGYTYNADDTAEFSAMQLGGWFHAGQLVTVWEMQPDVFKADCRGFCAIVDAVAPVGDPSGTPPTLPRGLIDVVPVDGDPGFVPENMLQLTIFDGATSNGDPSPGHGPDGTVPQVATWPGTELTYGELVWVTYIGQLARRWIAVWAPDLFGNPTAGDYYNAEPPVGHGCSTEDPYPATTPTDDTLETPGFTVTED